MIYATIDDRSGGVSASGAGSCSVCCCQPFFMKPGETNLLQINYAPWSVPFGGIGITQTPLYEITRDRSNCQGGLVNNFGPPTNNYYQLVVPANDPGFIVDVTASAGPPGNPMTYSRVPLSGPYHGTLFDTGVQGDGIWTYIPFTGYNGRDTFSFRQMDAQGRSIVRSVQLNVGTITAAPTPQERDELPAFGLVIDTTKVVIDQSRQTVTIPLKLGFDAEQCELFHVDVRQPARDCERAFFHITCFEIHVGKC